MADVYRPEAFAVDDADVLVALARSAGFGHLVVIGPGGLIATPLPFLISDDGTSVRGHVARQNPLWRSAPCDALLIVPVTDAYVSPSWCPSKQTGGKVVPTWNYEVVHASGLLTAHDDHQWVDQQVRDLTDVNESRQPDPWGVDDAPSDFVARKVRGIVGVGLSVTSLVGKRKLSQDKSPADQAGTVDGLTNQGAREHAVAEAMGHTDPVATDPTVEIGNDTVSRET